MPEPGTVRLLEHGGGVELRVGRSVLHGNEDLRRTIRFVLDHHDAPPPPAFGVLGNPPEAAARAVAQVLADLERAGVPLRTWGTRWRAWVLEAVGDAG